MKALHLVSFILLAVGGLNWGLFALMGWDISQFLGGMDSNLARLVYALVGLAAVVEIVTHTKNCRACKA